MHVICVVLASERDAVRGVLYIYIYNYLDFKYLITFCALFDTLPSPVAGLRCLTPVTDSNASPNRKTQALHNR
jgi:hypothetical protein